MRFERELLKGVAPLAVLEILSSGALYGYQLAQTLEERSGNILSLGKGSLYPLLYNLEGKGLVTSTLQEGENGRTRRYYALTDKGHAQLADQKGQWAKLQEAMDHIMDTGAITRAPGEA